MEYVVLRLAGKQYKVSKGSVIEVDKLYLLKDTETVFDDVLLHVNNNEVKVGTPRVLAVKVKAKVLDQIKGEKIRVAKFKAKVRYRRVMGFRPQLTRLEIINIESGEPQNKATSQTVSKLISEKSVSKATLLPSVLMNV